jgi:O-antigen/teichoic acid export membrane protein
MQRFARTIVRNSVFGMVAQFLIKLLSFGFSVLVIRNLGASEYGQYAAVIAFSVTFSFLSDLGLSPFSVRETARLRDLPGSEEKIRRLYGNVLALRIILSIVTMVLVVFAAWATRRPAVMIGAIALNSLGLLLYSVQGASDAILAGYERLDISSGAKVANQLAFVLVGALALYLGLGYYGLILATLVGVALMAYICWKGVHRLGVRLALPDPHQWGRLIRISIPFGIISFALGLSYRFDSVLLNIFRGDAETGFYNAAYNLVFSVVLFSNVINTALYPSLSRQSVTDPDRLLRSYERSLGYLMLVAFPVAIGTWAVADQIVPFLYEQAFAPAIAVLRIVIWVVPLMFASEFFGYIILIEGKEKKSARAVVISTSCNILVNLLLVPRFGIIAASIMTVATEAILVGQYLWITRKELRAFDLRKNLFLPLLAAVLMGGLTVALHSFVSLFVNILASAVCYGALLLLFRVVNWQDLALVLHFRSGQSKEIPS